MESAIRNESTEQLLYEEVCVLNLPYLASRCVKDKRATTNETESDTGDCTCENTKEIVLYCGKRPEGRMADGRLACHPLMPLGNGC